MTYLGPLTNRVPWTTKDTPGTLANLWLQQKGLKGRLLLLLFRLSSGRSSQELALQASKARSESSGSYKRLTSLYDSLQGSQGIVGGRMDPLSNRRSSLRSPCIESTEGKRCVKRHKQHVCNNNNGYDNPKILPKHNKSPISPQRSITYDQLINRDSCF